ncbi:MAG: transcriptional regulator LytR [Bacilli bacterium]|mgnify:CR=1 FL=1|nr:transcriptional regulator LytR [Bacilli bacterium]
MERRRRRKKGRTWAKIIGAIIFLIVLGIGSYAFYLYHSAKKLVNEDIHNPVDVIDTSLTKKKLSRTEPINVLLLGIDAEGDQVGRSDAIMVMQLDPTNDEMTIVSIPRDTRTEIVGKGFEDKINHAFAFGVNECGVPCGANMAIATVENLLDINIDYYVSMNMDGLVELVDELGTITVNNNTAWSDGTYDFPEGVIEMDGKKTKAYVRMRKQDPSGDFGRTQRQRKVIEGIIQKGASVGSLPHLTGMMDVLGKNMSTNMDFDDMKALFSDYRDTRKNINEYMMQGNGTMIDGIYYLIVSDDEIQKVHDMLTK